MLLAVLCGFIADAFCSFACLLSCLLPTSIYIHIYVYIQILVMVCKTLYIYICIYIYIYVEISDHNI